MEERPDVAMILSLIGGILIVISSFMMFMMIGYGWIGHGMMGPFGDMMGSLGGIMGGYMDMMESFGIPFGFMVGCSLIGIVSGILIIVGASMLNARPQDHYAWGIVILAFSVISFLGMAGFFVGAILGIIGGALAMSWRPEAKE
ncbi:MAG: DUF6114 domain-containing protein [Candidatus Atabeyarchaeum deiterrae]